jgi:hypothetical protein
MKESPLADLAGQPRHSMKTQRRMPEPSPNSLFLGYP